MHRALTFSYPAQLQLKGFVFYFIMHCVDSGKENVNVVPIQVYHSGGKVEIDSSS